MNRAITKKTLILVLISLLGVTTCMPAVAQTNIFVSPTGSDKYMGASPKTSVRTISQALYLSRKIKRSKDHPVNICLLKGTYFLSQTIDLQAEDSFLNVKAYKAAEVVLTGGEKLSGKWIKTGYHRWQQKVPKGFTQLFEGGHRLTLARYPNQGYWNPSVVDLQQHQLKFNHTFPTAFGQIKNAQLAVTGIWHWIVQNIDRFSPADSAVFTRTAIGPVRSSAKVSVRDRAYFENAYVFLDTLNEWYLDTATKTLTIMTDKDPNLKSYYYPVTHILFRIEGQKGEPVKGITIRDLRFEMTKRDRSKYERKGYQAGYWGSDRIGEPTFSPSAAIMCRYAESLTIENCFFRQLGEGAIAFEEGVNHSNISFNHFYDVGATPIQIARINDYIAAPHPLHHDYTDSTDAPSYDTLSNNLIRKCASVDLGSVGICVGYANHIIIERNTIMDMPYSGISVGWQWGNKLVHTNAHHNAIEWNLVMRCMRYLSDGGGIYTCGQQPCSSIKNNWVKDIGGGGIKRTAHGIYTDEGTGDFEIDDNFIERVQGYDFFAHENIWNTVSFHNNNGPTGKNELGKLRDEVRVISLPEREPTDTSLYGASIKDEY